MRANFLEVFNSFRGYLADTVPELGSIITYWDDPFKVSKNRAIMLPDGHTESGGLVTFSIILFASTVEKSVDAIPQTQMAVMEKIFRAVYNHDAPGSILRMAIDGADYFDPAPQSPNIGIMRVIIQLTVEYLDDCDY